MTIVHGFVINASEESTLRFKNDMEGFWSRGNNLRNNIKLHITLTLACLNDEKKQRVINLLKENIDLFKSFSISFKKVIPMGDNYIGLAFDSLEVVKMHNVLLELLQRQLQNSYNHKYLDKNLSDKELNYLQKYGFHRVKDFYVLLITIGHYESKQIRDSEIKFAKVPTGSFLFNVFQLDETMGDSYGYDKILWEAKLK